METKDFREISYAAYIPDERTYLLAYKDGTSEYKKLEDLSREESFMVQYYMITSRLIALKEMTFATGTAPRRLDLIIDMGDDLSYLKDLDISVLVKAMGGYIGEKE